MSQKLRIDFPLQKKQRQALNSPATEILYGGAAFGGKSHLIRVRAIITSLDVPGLQTYLFRRIRDDLLKTHLDSPSGFRTMLSPMVAAGFVKIKEDVIQFANGPIIDDVTGQALNPYVGGSKIYLCHCQHETDVGKYLSTDIHQLLMDELTTFTENMYRRLRGRVRIVGITIPEEYKDKLPAILSGSNPGNVGHLFVKSTFVDGCEPMEIRRAPDDEGGMLRQYIPARVNDNPIGVKADPGYIGRLKGMGSASLVKAMLEGDWNVVEGAFFDCWSEEKHVIRPFTIPEHWMRFMSGDWGSAKPFSFSWNAVCSDDYQHEGKTIPRGAIIRYKEWYGSPNHKDVGLKLTAEQVGEGLKERGIKELNYGVLDPAAFAEDGGPSIAERIYKGGGPKFVRADNKRVARAGAMGGWDQVRSRLVGDGDGRPMYYVTSNCVDLIRTLPAMQHDDNIPEDLNTHMEDHAVDEARYGLMSRPYIKTSPATPTSILQKPTFNDIIEQRKMDRG